jgi:nucleotide-binding universal stress UspA family protein
MKTILAATDFSEYSLNAVRYAADFAVDIRAQLVILNAFPLPITITEPYTSENLIESILESSEKSLQELVAQLKQMTKGKISVSSQSAFGTAESQIKMIANRVKPLAIVMGIAPAKIIEKALLGSTILQTINNSVFPVLIIPENVSYQPIREVGFACDLKDVGQFIPLEILKEWLSLFKANLNIVHVDIHNDEFNVSQLTESVTLQNSLQAFNPHFNFIRGTNLYEELNAFASKKNLDLLMIIPKGHGISQILQNKHSGKLITLSQIPVLAFHKNKTA